MVIHSKKAWQHLGLILLGCLLWFSGLACGGSQNIVQSRSSDTPTIVIPFLPTAPPMPTIVIPFPPTLTPRPTPLPPMSLSTTALNPNSSTCTLDVSGNTHTCIVTLQLTGNEAVDWTETNNQNILVNPSSGTLNVNQTTQQVSLAALPCQNVTFTFSDSVGDNFYTDWTCP
jgi:hypothetical protein